MSHQHTLWRLIAESPTDPVAWAQGLALHIQHSPLTTVAMRAGGELRSYLALRGCGRCLRGDCAVGCPTALFRRLVQSSLSDGELKPVAEPQGLAIRPYTHAALCWPTRHAQPLISEVLAAWPESRLTLHWSRTLGRLCVAGLLLTIGDASAPGSPAHGWRTLQIPTQLVPWLNRRVMPLALPGAPWRDEPFVLLTPGSAETSDAYLSVR